MGSTRLPGKVMLEIGGRPMIDWVVERARRIPGVDNVAVATSDGPGEEPLVDHLQQVGVPVHRGPEGDVLSRYVGAAEATGVDTVVRITGDCPLLMPEVSGRMLEDFGVSDCNYASNTLERTYPRGLDTEVVRRQALETAEREATDVADREHVTPFIRRHPSRFDLCSVADDRDRSHLRWTVDEEADLKLVRRVYSYLDDPMAGYDEVFALFARHPGLVAVNREVRQKSP